jgi:hypothetical protein
MWNTNTGKLAQLKSQHENAHTASPHPRANAQLYMYARLLPAQFSGIQIEVKGLYVALFAPADPKKLALVPAVDVSPVVESLIMRMTCGQDV